MSFRTWFSLFVLGSWSASHALVLCVCNYLSVRSRYCPSFVFVVAPLSYMHVLFSRPHCQCDGTWSAFFMRVEFIGLCVTVFVRAGFILRPYAKFIFNCRHFYPFSGSQCECY